MTDDGETIRDCPMCGSRRTIRLDEERGSCTEGDCGVSFYLEGAADAV